MEKRLHAGALLCSPTLRKTREGWGTVYLWLVLCSLLLPIPYSLFPRPCLLSLGDGEAAIDLFPVHDVPPCGKIVGALVLVLQVIGVLPHIVAENGEQPLRERRVLVRRSDHLQLASGEDEPSPA